MQGGNCCHELRRSLIIIIIASQPWIRGNNHTRSLWTIDSSSCPSRWGRGSRRRGRRGYFTSKRIDVSTTWIYRQQSACAGRDIPDENNSSGHIVNGRWRIFANASLVNRFVAEMDLAAISGAAISGAAFHNITIEETTPHRFQLTESGGNGTNTTTATGSVPPVSSNLTTRIYVDGNTPIIDNVPMTISIRGQVLAIEGIDIDETSITDTGQRDILSISDGRSIYGIVSDR